VAEAERWLAEYRPSPAPAGHWTSDDWLWKEPGDVPATVDKEGYLAGWRDCYQHLRPAPAGLDVRERLANVLAENGIAVENVASIGNADQWLPDYELTDRLIAAGVTLRAATRPAEDAGERP
jgi:hypothetical protein